MPAWLDLSASVGWRLLAVAAMAAVAVAIALAVPASTAAVMVSLILAATLAPTAAGLRRRGLSRSIAAAVAFVLGAAVVVTALLLLAAAIVPDAQALTAAIQHGLAAIRDHLEALGAPAGVWVLLDILAGSLRADLAPDPKALAGTLIDVVMLIVLGTFLTYFLLADGDLGWSSAMRRVQPWQAETVTADARRGLERVAWYVRRTVLFAVLDAVVTFGVLAALGVPLPAALAAVALVAGLVPYLGAIAGGAIVFLATLALAGGGPAVTVVLATLLAWLVAGRLLERTPMGSSVDVNPVLVLVAVPAGFGLLGVLGVMAALPLVVFGLALSRAVVTALGGPPGPDDIGPRAAGTDGVPPWLDRLAQWSWRGLVLAGLGWLVVVVVNRLPSVVAPMSLALVIAATLLPIVAALGRRGWNRGLAAGLAMVLATGVTVAACVAAVAVTAGSLGDIIDAAAAGAGRFDLEWLREAILALGSEVRVDVVGAFASSAALLLGIGLALVAAFFLLRDGPDWWFAATSHLAPGRREPLEAAGHRAVEILAGYMGGTAVISMFGALTSGLIMVVLGLPLALPIVVIGFFFGFVPYLGSFLTTAIAVLVTFALGTPSDMAVMLAFTVVFNIVQGNIVTPIVYGRGLALHPAVVLMAIPVGGELAGILGMFLVVPAAAVVAATWSLLPRAIDGSGLPDEVELPGRATGARVPAA